MKIIKTWLNGWHSRSRCQAAQPFPCLFGCRGAQDNLHHYIICPELDGLCKFLYRGLSHLLELMVHLCCMYGAYHVLIKYVNCHHDIYIENCEQLVIGPRQKAWSVFAEAYHADARDFGVSVPHYSLPPYIYWNPHFDDPTAVTASLSPAPVCNAIQEFAPACELADLGYPVSSPAEVELTGDLDSASAFLT